jgi:peptide/nickel transport system ATP-binding protein
MSSQSELIRIAGLSTVFSDPRTLRDRAARRAAGGVRAVDDVSLSIARNEIVGLVGESGSGKTTLGRTILGLTQATTGTVTFDGTDITHPSRGQWSALRRRMQMIFQDPYASLSPRMRVSAQLTEPYRIHGTPASERYSVAELLEMVNLSSEQADKYPHELSGGQARRIGIARTLALRPEFIVADEPTSGLDVSAAAAILNLLQDLTFLVITHNVNTLSYLSDRLAVMYLGQLIETGVTRDVLAQPSHPYTRALLAAVPDIDPDGLQTAQTELLKGEIPSPRNPPSGCRFRTRCVHVRADKCQTAPVLSEIAPGHAIACRRWPEVQQDPEWVSSLPTVDTSTT